MKQYFLNRLAINVLMLTVLSVFSARAEEPMRENGLSVHLLPDKVAQLKGANGGFTVTDPATKKMGTTYPEPEKLLEYFYHLPEAVRQNGIWIVTTNPEAYSESENSKVKKLIALSSANKTPIYISRAIELPHGWRRVDSINVQPAETSSPTGGSN